MSFYFARFLARLQQNKRAVSNTSPIGPGEHLVVSAFCKKTNGRVEGPVVVGRVAELLSELCAVTI